MPGWLHRVAAVAVSAMLVSSLGGCAGHHQVPLTPAAAADPLSEDCAAAADGGPAAPPPAPELTRLASDAVLVSAVRCVYESRRVPGDGE